MSKHDETAAIFESIINTPENQIHAPLRLPSDLTSQEAARFCLHLDKLLASDNGWERSQHLYKILDIIAVTDHAKAVSLMKPLPVVMKLLYAYETTIMDIFDGDGTESEQELRQL